MSASSRIATLAMSLAFGSAISGAAIAAPSATLEQVRNGRAEATTTPDPSWASGNAGASNAHYLESHSIAYRAVMGDLPTDGTVIELVIGYDVKRSGSYALDYLTHYQRLLPHVLFGHRDPEVFVPLDGIAGVDPIVTTSPIPVATRSIVIDPDGAESNPPVPQPTTSMDSLPDAERLMTLFGGTLIDVSYVSEADVSLETKSSESQVMVRFTANSPTAVLAWGGHIASRWDWGFESEDMPRSAGGISGSSYHMRLVDWNLGNLGNQDRSMSTDAVFPVPICGISNAGPFCAGSTNTHTAPSGMESYTWTLFDNTSGAVFVGGNMGTSVVVQAGGPGSYGLMLTTTASGFEKSCATVVTIDPPAVADAGADQIRCVDNPQVQLAGFVSGGVPSWSGGSGSFSPSSMDLNAVYTPTSAEVASGSVTLTLTSAPTLGPCPPASDEVLITFEDLPVAAAGSDQTVCASNPLVQLAGSVSGSVTGGTWSGGAGLFNPGPSVLDATYLPTPAEIAAGSVTLTLTSDDPTGPCGPVSDQVLITIQPDATADAGPDQLVCASNALVQLAGSIGGSATDGIWSGGNGNFTPNASTLDATYLPSEAEIAAGEVTLILTASVSIGPCPPANDQVTITIDPATVVDAGPDQIMCATSPQAQLAGSVSGVVSGGTWSGGNGSFSPSATDLNATYTPTPEEIAAGNVTLVLTSEESSRPCPPASDELALYFMGAATVDAGPDQTACAESPEITLEGEVGGAAGGGIWSGGQGTFAPSNRVLRTIYSPTPQEIASGSVTLTLTTVDPPGPCPPVSDQVQLTYSSPTLNMPDRIVCEGIPFSDLCANPNGGVGPYTYLWNTGATTECIQVSIPGPYYVTVTDALGCRTSGSTEFGHRDCEGQLTHTNTTCSTFSAGTGDDLPSSDISINLRDNVITSIAPGVFFYWTFFLAPSENFTVDLVQVRNNPDCPYLPIQNDQVVLYDAIDCTRLGEGTQVSPGQGQIDIQGAAVGQPFIVSVKYSLKALIGHYLDPEFGIHYDFQTVINGEVVDEDPDGLQIGSPGIVDVGDDPPPAGGGPIIVRLVPNPFQNGTRLTYSVPSPQDHVSIRVYNVAGRHIRTLVSGKQAAGMHVAQWDGRDENGVAARQGIYFVHVRIGSHERKVRAAFLR